MSVSKPAAVQPVPPLSTQPGPFLSVERQMAGTGASSLFRQPLRPIQAPPRWQRTPPAPGVDPRRAAADPGTALETLLCVFAAFPCEVLANPAWQLAFVADSSLVDALQDDDLVQACPHAIREEAFQGLLRDRIQRKSGYPWRTVDAVVQLADTPRDILDAIYRERQAASRDRASRMYRTLTFRLASPESTVALWRSGLQLEREALAADRTRRVTNERRLRRFDSGRVQDLRVVAGCVTSYQLIDRVLAATHPEARPEWIKKLARDPNWVVRGAALEALAARKGAA